MKKFLITLSLLVVMIAAVNTNLFAQLKPIPPPDPKNPESASQMKSIEELVDRYFTSLNEPDEKRRRDLVRQVWAEKCKFVVVPLIEGNGLDEIQRMTTGGIDEHPNSTIRRTSKIDGSGTYYRWNFTLSQNDGKYTLSGVDFAVIVDGKLQSVIGFLDSW